MGREHLLEESNWLSLPRRRRLTIGDLIVAVALTAFALSAGHMSSLSNSEQLSFSLLTFVFLGLQTVQWRIASLWSSRGPTMSRILGGTLSILLAVLMLVCLITLGLLFPEGFPLVVGTMLLLTIYLTTWD